MRINIVQQGVELGPDMKDHVERRIQFALSRFATRIREVGVRLADVNGNRGGIDQHCRIIVQLIPKAKIVIEDIGADHREVIDRAADRAGRAVARELRRRWETRRRASGARV